MADFMRNDGHVAITNSFLEVEAGAFSQFIRKILPPCSDAINRLSAKEIVGGIRRTVPICR
ncbi:hypothetical protein D3C71_2193060 [compost metagenome]